MFRYALDVFLITCSEKFKVNHFMSFFDCVHFQTDSHLRIHMASWLFSQWTPEHRGPVGGRCGHLSLETGTWHFQLTLKRETIPILQQFVFQVDL